MLETEVKFLVRDLSGLAARLEAAGARLVQPEVREFNLRFDRRDGSLVAGHEVLRLRQDTRARLTYKSPARVVAGASERTEIEVEVGDFKSARRLLEALGYTVVFVYEKYRRTYMLEEVEAVLDRTPLGDFVELEGPGGAEIRDAAARLGLDWQARTLASYPMLFEAAQAALGLDNPEMTFEGFHGVVVEAAALGLREADFF